MLALHIKIKESLKDGPLRSDEIIKKMPDEKPNSIRAIITLHPELFIRISNGVVGLQGRDEYLAEFYEIAKTKIPPIILMIKCFLSSGAKTLQEIYTEFPDIKEESIQGKLKEDENIKEINERFYLVNKLG